MLNRKYYPFERNNYYYGKLLTAKDFESEQRYFNDKRRFLNRLTGANGILAGLGVIMADDLSVIVQAGCALDASGREIVVPETRVVKLTTIDGYEQLESACAYLGIVYDEQPAEQVFSVMSDAQDQNAFNKTQEKYKLTLADESVAAKIPSVLGDFIKEITIYSDSDISIIQYLPKYLVRGSNIAVRTEILQKAKSAQEISFEYELEAPGFDRPGTLTVNMSGVVLKPGKRKSVRMDLHPQEYLWGANGKVTITAGNLVVRKNEESFTLNDSWSCTLYPVERSFIDQYIEDFYSRAMDKQLSETFDERLWIARLNLIRQGSSMILDSVEPPPFQQYVYNAQQLMTLQRLEEYYPASFRPAILQGEAGETSLAVTGNLSSEGEGVRSTACGVLELGLGLGYSAHETFFSDEIMHGLGKGPVYVDVGVEYLRAGDRPEENAGEIYLGDVSIFEDDAPSREERVYRISTAVKVLPERGTFIVGVRLGETSGLISLRLRWYAFRLSETSKQIQEGAESKQGYIMLNPDTIVVPPKGSAHFTPVFINMPAEACRYSLIDARGGEIDNNGVYTAPADEGVYEIRVEAISDPKIYTHAFAIVSQKKKDS